MRGIHQTPVEHQIAGDVGVEITVIATATDPQCLAQGHQVFVGAAQGRQADGFHLEDVPGFPRLFLGTARQRLHGVQRVDHRPQVAAVTLANLDQAGKRQHAHGFAHGVAADAQFGRQLGLGGQALANVPCTFGDAQAQLFQGLID